MRKAGGSFNGRSQSPELASPSSAPSRSKGRSASAIPAGRRTATDRDQRSSPRRARARSRPQRHYLIENFKALRAEFAVNGRVFATETDSEVAAFVVEEELAAGKTPEQAVHAALKRLRGAFALVYLFEGEENLLIGAREGAPLAVGYGEGEMYLGSDALALAPFTDRVAHLEDGDWVVVTREGADIRDALGRPVKRLREARFAVAKDIKERDLFLASQGISGMSDDDLMYTGDRPLDLEHGLLSCTWPDAGRQDCPFPDLWGHLG